MQSKSSRLSAAAADRLQRAEIPAAGASLRPAQAAALLGIGRATLCRWSRDRADFPKARRLSARCTVFDQAELIAWRDRQSALPKAA